MPVRFTTLTTVLIVAICSTIWLPVSLPVGGLNIRASQVVLLPCLVLLLRQASWRISVFAAVAAVLGALFIASMLFWTVWWHESLRPVALGRVGLHLLNLLHWVVLHTLLVRTGDVRPAVMTTIVTVTAFNAYYLAMVFLAAAGVSLPSPILMQADQPTLVGGVIVTQTVQRFELGGVTAGCLSAACLIMLLAMVMDRPERRPKQWLLTSVLLGAGITIGYSRQAAVSIVIGVVLIAGAFAIRRQLGQVLKVGLRFVAALAIAGALLALIPATRIYFQAFSGRASLLISPDSYSTGTVDERVRMWGAMWDDIEANPLMGQGQDAYLKYYPPTDPSTTQGPGGGAHNFPIEVWHAGGLIALLAIVGLHALAFGPAIVGVITARRDHVCLLIALVAGTASVVAAALTNLIYWTPTYWLFLAMISASRVSLLRSDAPPGRHAIG